MKCYCKVLSRAINFTSLLTVWERSYYMYRKISVQCRSTSRDLFYCAHAEEGEFVLNFLKPLGCELPVLVFFFLWGGRGFGQHNSFFIKTASRVLWSFVIHRRKMSARVLIHLYISWHFRKFWFHVYWVMGFLTLDDFLCFFLPSKKTLASLLPAVTINKSVQFIWNVLWEAVRLSRIECNNKMSTYR